MSVTDEIKGRLDIVEVISAYVPLKKAGRSYKGLCPFHNEKTPSFAVFPDSQNWHCFGACGIGGDIFSFVMKRENLDFGEALKLLAAKAGVELEERERPTPAEQHLERLRELVAHAAGYCQNLLLKAGEAVFARDYLGRRGLLPATWEEWQLGYALDSWDALKDHLQRKGYGLEEIEEAGLIIRRDDGSGYYDRYRGRLMIPIRDGQGRAIGFGARVLKEDPAHPQPKYINSPQTPLFDKSTVFGLDAARKAIRDADLAVLVEGYMDVLMSHQVGVRNVVAGMGTALTEAQLRQIKRYTNNITLALDPDTAGDHATLRGLETARQSLERDWEPVITPTGLVRQQSRLKAQLRIATLPDGLDPDELAYRNPDDWRKVIAAASPIVDYYLAVLARREDLSTARGKANVVASLAPLIHEIGSAVERAHYIQALARLVQIDERLVASEVDVARPVERPGAQAAERLVRSGQPQAQTAGSQPDAAADEAQSGEAAGPGQEYAGRTVPAVDRATLLLEEHLLGRLLANPRLLAELDEDMQAQDTSRLRAEDFAGAEHRAILEALCGALPPDEDWTIDAVLIRLPDALHARCIELVRRIQREPPLAQEKGVKDAGDLLLRLRGRHLTARVTRLHFLSADGEAAGEREEVRRYNELAATYTIQKRHIFKLLNSRTMAGALNQSPDHA